MVVVIDLSVQMEIKMEKVKQMYEKKTVGESGGVWAHLDGANKGGNCRDEILADIQQQSVYDDTNYNCTTTASLPLTETTITTTTTTTTTSTTATSYGNENETGSQSNILAVETDPEVADGANGDGDGDGGGGGAIAYYSCFESRILQSPHTTAASFFPYLTTSFHRGSQIFEKKSYPDNDDDDDCDMNAVDDDDK
ncbi:unnamed protein product [Thelazia callipaeda]|uniref:NAC domain-containing protein n=1 Tax=Thelazia callipaeda TaxID=103827 RepID=A0A0N5CNY3_THECL|nr:unnamed protein product [Thelazia callipaeda]